MYSAEDLANTKKRKRKMDDILLELQKKKRVVKTALLSLSRPLKKRVFSVRVVKEVAHANFYPVLVAIIKGPP